MSSIESLIDRLKGYSRVVIQAHDFPDHDAVASAFGLSLLFQNKGLETLIIYNGLIDRISLQNMIDQLDIPIWHWRDTDVSERDLIVTVDGCIGEKNVTDLPGREIAVIDHHQVQAPEECWFQDVRPEYGATATIIYEYYRDFRIDMNCNVATALQIGLAIDTANLTRGFVAADVEAFAYFHKHADQELVGKITRNSMQQHELSYYQRLLDSLLVKDKIAFAHLEQGCPKNMLGILGDFLLALDEVDVVILSANSEERIQLSLRSECSKTDVARLAQQVLQGQSIGFGGGHAHMAGGIIDKRMCRQETSKTYLYSLFFDAARKMRS